MPPVNVEHQQAVIDQAQQCGDDIHWHKDLITNSRDIALLVLLIAKIHFKECLYSAFFL